LVYVLVQVIGPPPVDEELEVTEPVPVVVVPVPVVAWVLEVVPDPPAPPVPLLPPPQANTSPETARSDAVA
jgi:hypothetical protein